MAINDYWLYQWMDSYLVTSVERATALLEKPAPLEALRQMAYEASQATSAATIDTTKRDNALVAGGNLDLSADISCMYWGCQKRQVDELFSHVWHYFDRIIVVGRSAREFTEEWDENYQQYIIALLQDDIRMLLYLRHIGADKLLTFVEKPEKCSVHWKEHAQEIGLQIGLPEAKKFIHLLADEGEIESWPHEDGFETSIWHPSLLKRFTLTTSEACDSSLPKRRRMAEHVVSLLSGKLVSDIQAAQQFHAPLGSDFFLHREMLRAAKRRATEADVVFHLNLPILEGVEPELLLRIREDEHEHFEAFRSKLRLAIQERLDRSKEPNAGNVAFEIKKDVIEPALNDIERRLKVARQALSRKAGLSLGLGALITTCGLLTANPLVTTTGVGAMATSIGTGHKYFEEQRDIALSDMYFLWYAQQHAAER